MTPERWKQLRAEVHGLTDEANASLGANIDHLVHVLIGYRETILDRESDSPYSPGGAQDGSWRTGNQLALKDLHEHSTLREGEQR